MADDYGILPEHASPEKEVSESDVYSASLDEKKLISRINKDFEKARKFRMQYDEKWLDYYKMFRGKQWKEQRPSYRHSEVLNLIFQTLQSQIPILTDIRPRFEFLPQEPTDFELAEILNDVAEADWIKNCWSNELTELIYDGNIYGTGLLNIEYDEDKQEICLKSSDPFYNFPAPSAKDTNRECPNYIYAEPMDLSEIKKKWKNGKYVKADLIDLLNGSKTDLGPIRFKSPTDSRTVIDGGSSHTYDVTEKDKALVLYYYAKPDELVKNGSDEKDEYSYKYPNGKKCVIANEVLLEEGPNKYDHGEYPYHRWQNYILPREFWGMSECEQLEGPQRTFNKIFSFVLDILTLMGNPLWVVDSTAGVDTDNLINRPGSVIEKEPNSEVRRVEGVQLQSYILPLLDRLKEWFDQIGGSNDVTRGLNPTGVTAASAIDNLQNAAQTRLRQKSRTLEDLLQKVGQQYLSLVMQYYTAPKVFRLTNKEGANKFFKFYSKPENGSVVVERFSEEGKSMGINEFQMRGKMDVRVTIGSSLPFSKAEKRQRLMDLYDRKVIDSEELLKGLDYPNYQAVLDRVQKQQQQEAAAQQQQKAG